MMGALGHTGQIAQDLRHLHSIHACCRYSRTCPYSQFFNWQWHSAVFEYTHRMNTPLELAPPHLWELVVARLPSVDDVGQLTATCR